jgi:WD40 repeat protein
MRGLKKVGKKSRRVPGSSVSLDRVIGITSRGNSGVSLNSPSNELAYIASGVVVFYNVQANSQVSHVFTSNNRPFSCLNISSNGKYLATGEGVYKQPEICVWESTGPNAWSIVKHLRMHKYGIDLVSFSPSGNLLVSIGTEHDKAMFVWSLTSTKDDPITSNKITKKIYDIAWAPSGEFFVTVGVKSVKYWYIDRNGVPITTASTAQANIKCMASRLADLAEMKDKTFVSVAVTGQNVFTITEDGLLCVLTYERTIDKWMDIQVKAGFSLSASGNMVVCGCDDGVIRFFDANTLEHIRTLTRPPPLGEANVTIEKQGLAIQTDSSATFADVISVKLFENNTRLFSLYSDKTVFIWDLTKLDRVVVSRSFLNHSASINDIQILPTSTLELTKFATASSDKTIRLWNLFHTDPRKLEHLVIKNVYSRDLSRIIYVSKNVNHFKARNNETDEEGCIKCIRCSPDERFIASGDVTGNLRVHDIDTLQEVVNLQAHDSDILCLDYTGKEPAESRSEKVSKLYLATGSRDRLIHIFDADHDYNIVTTIEDHSSSVNDLTFVRMNGDNKLISCSSDKSFIFRSMKESYNEVRMERYAQVLKLRVHSISPHPIHNTIVTGEEKAVRLYELTSGKVQRTIDENMDKPISVNNLKVAMDSSGYVIASAGNDKFVRLIDYNSGKVLDKINVGEICTAAAFTVNGKKLLTCTGDGCIFIWRLAPEIVTMIRTRMQKAQLQLRRSLKSDEESHTGESVSQSKDEKSPEDRVREDIIKLNQEPPAIKMHESLMPRWAHSNLKEIPRQPSPEKKATPFELVQEIRIPGRWGESTLEIGFEDVETPIEQIRGEEEKGDVFNYIGAVDVESDEEPKVSIDKEEKPIIVDKQPAPRESFVVTKSAKNSDHRDEESKEITYDVTEEDQKFPDSESAEHQPEKRNIMRESLSASFWQKKKMERKEEAPSGFFDIEPVVSDTLHVPKIQEIRKKDSKAVDIQSHISDMRKRLESQGILSDNPDINFLRKRRNQAEIAADMKAAALKPEEEQPGEEQKPEFEENPDYPEDYMAPLRCSSDRFNSPYNQPDLDFERASLSCDFSSSLGTYHTSSRLSKSQFTVGFADLKKSLENVNSFFMSVNPNDPEFAESLEESGEEINEIQR